MQNAEEESRLRRVGGWREGRKSHVVPDASSLGKLLYKNPGEEGAWPRVAFLLLENQVRVTATYWDSGMFSSMHRRREGVGLQP